MMNTSTSTLSVPSSTLATSAPTARARALSPSFPLQIFASLSQMTLFHSSPQTHLSSRYNRGTSLVCARVHGCETALRQRHQDLGWEQLQGFPRVSRVTSDPSTASSGGILARRVRIATPTTPVRVSTSYRSASTRSNTTPRTAASYSARGTL